MKKVRLLKKCILFVSIIALIAVSIIMLFSCTVGEANKTLTSFGIEWPAGFNYNCGSKNKLDVKVQAFDQFGGVFNWSGLITIVLTNTDITVIPSEFTITNGTITTELKFEHSSTDELETNIKLSNGDITTALVDAITVYPNVTGVSLGQSSLEIVEGDTVQLTATVTPENAWNKAVSWDSGNEAVASVDVSGLVTANFQGETTITVTTEDSGSTDSCSVLVTIFRWQTMLGGSSTDSGLSIHQTADSGYIVVGGSESSTVAGPALLQAHQGIRDCYIVKFNADGSISWQTMLGGSSFDHGYSIQQTADSGYIMAGFSESSTVAPVEIPLIQAHQGVNDCYIIKLW